MAEGLVVAMNQSNVLRSKEALLLANLLTKEKQGRDDKGVRKVAGIKEKDIPKGEVLKRHGTSWLRLEQAE